MNFKNIPPKWNEKGTEPTTDLQEKGFTAGYKPPAAYFNYLFHSYTECLKELQNKTKNETVNNEKWTCNTTVGKWSRLCKLTGYSNYLLTVCFAQTGQALFYTYTIGTSYDNSYISQIGAAGHHAYSDIRLRIVQGSNDEEYYLEVYNNFGADGVVNVNCNCSISLLNGRSNAAVAIYTEYTQAEESRPVRASITSQHNAIVSDSFVGELNGNAATATKLKEKMKLQMGDTQKDLDGSENLTFSPTEIGYRHEWTTPIKCATWSRLCQVKMYSITIGAKYLLNICATRSGVIYNDTFIVTTHHSKDGNIIKLSGHSYDASTGYKVRVLSSTSGHGYIDIFDNLNGAASETTQNVICRLIPIACGDVIPYTVFTSGEEVPTDYKVMKELTIDNSDMQMGDIRTGNVIAETDTEESRKLSVGNALHKGTVSVNADGVFGLYDTTYSKYIIKSNADGKVELDGNAKTADTAVKATQDSDGNEIAKTYIPIKKWGCNTSVGNWTRICKINGYSSHILTIGLSQNGQAVNNTYIIGTGYSSGTISQIGSTGHSGYSEVELRITKAESEMSFYVEFLNNYSADSTNVAEVNFTIIKLDKYDSTIETFNTYTPFTSTEVEAHVVGVKDGIVSPKFYGNLEGNAPKDGEGNVITNTYEKKISILPPEKGGTGKDNLREAANDIVNSMPTGTTAPADNDYFVAQKTNGGDTNVNYYRKPMTSLWNYIKGKIETVLGLTATTYGGTATKATKDGSGNTITSTYAKKSIYGDDSISLGILSGTTTGNRSIEFGDDVSASGECSVALGYSNTSSAPYSFTACQYNTASGECSVALGFGTTALTNQLAIGHWNDTTIATANSMSGASTGTAFVIGNGAFGNNDSNSNAFRVTGQGATYAKSAYNSTGADYAEFAEWADQNPDNEDRRGYFVTYDETKPNMIRKANAGDYILGIVSGNPCIIGNSDEAWLGRYVFDEFGSIVYEEKEIEMEHTDPETGEVTTTKETITTYKTNPDYDPEKKYVHRKDRPEWATVGWIGVLSARDDGTCVPGKYCKVSDGGIATAAERGTDTYRVLERVTENIVKVAMK